MSPIDSAPTSERNSAELLSMDLVTKLDVSV